MKRSSVNVVFIRWTGAWWICTRGLTGGYVLPVALVGSQRRGPDSQPHHGSIFLRRSTQHVPLSYLEV